MFIREKLEVKEYFYPFAEKINPILYDIISHIKDEYGNVNYIKKSQQAVRWIRNNRINIQNQQLTLLENWISQIVERDFVIGKRSPLICFEMWGVLYEDETEIEIHSHPDALYSTSYYVNAPKGSAPLVFKESNHKIKAEEGKLVVFDGRLDHYVPKSKKVKDKKRCVIVCNFKGVD
tara:strand:+ start:48 stop:578 length:531 start_codon:yes stop_codon:yes gene_type:complete